MLYVEAADNLGNMESLTVSYSIRNWAVLELLPSSALGSVNLKVDAEGADLDVLKGAGDRIAAFDTVIIECNSRNSSVTFRDGECTFEDAKAYMESMAFDMTSYERQGNLVNMYFINRARSSSSGILLPTYFRSSILTFRKFYKQFAISNITTVGRPADINQNPSSSVVGTDWSNLYWDSLDNKAQKAATLLGFNEESWDSDSPVPIYSTPFDELADDKMEAVVYLGLRSYFT